MARQGRPRGTSQQHLGRDVAPPGVGRLAANRRKYANDPEPMLRKVFQPQRTDLEPPVAGKEVQFLEVMIDPVSD
jgi:hypothetical protein